VTDQLVWSREIVSGISVGFVKYIEYVVWENCSVFNLNQIVVRVTTMLEALILFFEFCSDNQQYVRHSY